MTGELDNINIVLTRAKNQSVDTINQLEDLGAKVLSFPTIKITTIRGNRKLDETIKNINSYNSLIFTSENAVKSLFKKTEELGIEFDPRAFFVISIGDKTTQVCTEFGLRIDFQPNQSSSESLIRELGYIDLVGRIILIPCSSMSKPEMFIPLQNHGATVQSIPIYENSVNDTGNLNPELDILKNTKIDLYIFTSPSTFCGFLKILNIDNPKKYFKNKDIAVIGPVTKQAIQNKGIEPNIIPQKFTMNNLIEEIKEYYYKEKAIH